MKYIITESQKFRLLESEEILEIPGLEFFNDDWFALQRFLERKGSPPYRIVGNLYLHETPTIKTLGNLISVGGYLNVSYTEIESLGNLTSVGGNLDLGRTKIKSLGNLTSVGGALFVNDSNIESLGNLTYVGGYFSLFRTPISKKYSEEQIRAQVEVKGNIYL